jgi:hypothetical protein
VGNQLPRWAGAGLLLALGTVLIAGGTALHIAAGHSLSAVLVGVSVALLGLARLARAEGERRTCPATGGAVSRGRACLRLEVLTALLALAALLAGLGLAVEGS